MVALTSERAHGAFLQSTFDYPVFSFFFRLHGGSSKQPHDLNHIRGKIRDFIQNSTLTDAQKEQAIEKANELIKQVNEHVGAKSISLFVAQTEGELHHHFVYLPERQYCGNQFALCEFLWAEQMSRPYILVLAGPSALAVYEGRGLTLEKTAKCLELDRLQSAFKHWHEKRDLKHGTESCKSEPFIEALQQLVRKFDAPLLVIGKEYLPLPEDVSALKVDIKGVFTGNKVDCSSAELQTVVDGHLELCIDEDTARKMAMCEQSLEQRKLATGELEILQCAKEARGSILLLEPPSREGGLCQLDSVQQSIRHILLNHGSVHFVKEGALAHWVGSALILRF
ncbi:MAG: hypothetical protein K2W95_34880 [Candidatus Obscuribacterales bacterium]|nr:hypothetical protein [Candidatus Obscuribacterales bacterium]